MLARLEGIAQDATVLDVGCGTGRVTKALLELVHMAAYWPWTRRRTWSRSHVADSATASRCGARTHLISRPTSPSMRSSRRLRCTGSQTMIASGRGSRGCYEEAESSRFSAVERATSIACARSSMRSPATAPRSSWAGRRGSSQDLKRGNGACGTLGSLRRDVGLRSARPIRGTWPRSSPLRFSPRTLRACRGAPRAVRRRGRRGRPSAT